MRRAPTAHPRSIDEPARAPTSDGAPPSATRVAAAALLRDAAAGRAAIAGPRLVVLTGPRAGERHAVGPEATLGRGRAATVRIADPRASRLHARVRVTPAGATIEDLRSKNGVRLNGVRMDARVAPLRPGDELSIGDTSLALEEDAPAHPPFPAPARSPRASPAGSEAGRRGVHAAAAALLAACAAALALAAS